MKTYLITGATGAIGAAIIPLLLADEETHVRLLIRAKNPDHLDARLEKLFSFWQYPRASDRRNRIRAFAGDACLPLLGMDPHEYAELAGECSHIIHSAGNVRMNLSLDEARSSSVESARNIMALADDCRIHGHLQKIEFVSTVGVAGRMKGQVPESWIDEMRSFHNTYEEGKAEAERFIRGQVESGFPVTVHRPSMVVGDSTTGRIIHFQVFYHLCEFLSGRRTFGILPNVGNASLDIIPVDYVAKAILWSSNQLGTIGRIMHLCSGPNHSIAIQNLRNGVINVLKSLGCRLPAAKTIPLRLFRACLPPIGLLVRPPIRRAMRALPFVLEYLAEEQSFANETTAGLLASEGIALPGVADYLDTNLRFYFSTRNK